MTTQISSNNIQSSTLTTIGGSIKITSIQVANSTYIATGGNSSTTKVYVNGTQIISVADAANYTGLILGVGVYTVHHF